VSREEMLLRYRRAVEKAMRRVPVKNGVVDIDSIWVETSIPYDLLQEILSRDDLVLPENVERVNTKSHAGEKSGKQRRTKGPRGDKVRD
jgi:hypothetical protein